MSRLESRIASLKRFLSVRPLLLLTLAALSIGTVSRAERSDALPIVPLAALVVNPDRYDGAEIEVVAWGVVQYELAALFLAESDYRHLVFANGVWLDLPEGPDVPINAKGYMSVVGKFQSGDKARGFAGRMTAIKRVTLQTYQVPPD